MYPNTFVTRNDAVDCLADIITCADSTLVGDVTDAYDIDAIADEVLTTTGHGTTYRFALADIDDEDFWTIVTNHAL